MKVALRLLRPLAGDAPEPHGWSGPSSLTSQVDLTLSASRDRFADDAAQPAGVAEAVIARDLGRVLDACEAWQQDRVRAADAAALSRGLAANARAGSAGSGSAGGRPPATVDAPEDVAAAQAWLRRPDLLQEYVRHLGICGLVGETVNATACLLAATSRLQARPLAVLIQSSSAAGKTTLMDAVLDLMPEESRKRASAISEMALYYEKEGLSHSILAIAEEEGASEASYSLKLLQSDGALTFSRPVKDPETGELVTRTHRVEGPVQLIVTTTKPLPDDEWANRCLVLTVGEHAAQTAAIHARQRAQQSWAGQAAALARAAVVRLHHAAQRQLRPQTVIMPFAEQLRFPVNRVRMRRDFPKYLALIAASTVLHQHQREQVTRDFHGQTVTGTLSTSYDLAVANALADALLGQSAAELSAPTQGFLAELDGLIEAWASAAGIARGERSFTRGELHTATQRSHASLKRFLNELIDQEWLTMERAGPTHPERYRVQFPHRAPERARICLGLTPVTEIDPGFSADLSWLRS
jgi:hypothetical protein